MYSPLTREFHPGKTYTADDKSLIPFSKAWQLNIPGMKGGFIWNQPASLLVREADGTEKVIPILDPTRQVIYSLIAVCLGASVMMWLITLRKRGV